MNNRSCRGRNWRKSLAFIGKQPTPNGKKDQPKMRGVLLWLIGIPIPIIILLYLFNVI